MTSGQELPLSSRSNQEFETLSLASTVGAALDWATSAKLVLTDHDGRPAGVLDTATLSQLDPATPLTKLVDTLPTTIVVDASASQRQALSSWAFSQADHDSSVVFTDGGVVVGVWSGPALVAVLARIRWRVNQDMQLPGDPGIAAIARGCRFTHEGGRCATVVLFTEYPEHSRPCPNTSELPAHDFEWQDRS
jgi:hypothetical protein